jgi:hypothetical protein
VRREEAGGTAEARIMPEKKIPALLHWAFFETGLM